MAPSHIHIIFRNDDICALSDADKERRILHIFEKHRIPQIIGVVPNIVEDMHDCRCNNFHALNENPNIVSLIKEYQEKGLLEIAQHGFSHRTNAHHFCRRYTIDDKHYFQGIDRRWLAFEPSCESFSEFNGFNESYIQELIAKGKLIIESTLNITPETFIFPWNSLDEASLKALKTLGFRRVLYSDGTQTLQGMQCIRQYHYDLFTLPQFFKETENISHDIFTHISYHSWMLTENEISRLDALLADVVKRANVTIITTKEIKDIPNIDKHLAQSRMARHLTNRSNKHKEKAVILPPFYILNSFHNFKTAAKAFPTAFLVDIWGLKRSFYWFGLATLISAFFYAESRKIMWALLFLISLSITFKIRSMRQIASKQKKEYEQARLKRKTPDLPQDFIELASLAHKNPFNRLIRQAYLKAFENQKDPSPEEKNCYHQLQYVEHPESVEPINRLADNYLAQHNNFFACMALDFSLNINPGQPGIYQKLEQLTKKVAPLMPGQLLPETCTVSVIMPTYNKAHCLKESIASLLNQTFKDFELIVINDGGADIISILHSFNDNRIKYINLPENNGVSHATNQGILNARGKYIAYLDDDDIYYPNHLETLVNAAESSRKAFAYDNTFAVDGQFVNGTFVPQTVRFVWDKPANENTIIHEPLFCQLTVLHRKEVFNTTGLFREGMKMAQDYEFWLRAAKHFKFEHSRIITSEYRHTGQNSVLTNKIGLHFHGWLICNYHRFLEGKISILKSLLRRQEMTRALQCYNLIKDEHTTHFKDTILLEELILLAYRFKDFAFLTVLKQKYESHPLRPYRRSRHLLQRMIKFLPNILVAALVRNVLKQRTELVLI